MQSDFDPVLYDLITLPRGHCEIVVLWSDPVEMAAHRESSDVRRVCVWMVGYTNSFLSNEDVRKKN